MECTFRCMGCLGPVFLKTNGGVLVKEIAKLGLPFHGHANTGRYWITQTELHCITYHIPGTCCEGIPSMDEMEMWCDGYNIWANGDDEADRHAAECWGIKHSESLRLSRFVKSTLCTTAMVQSYFVPHWPALCPTNLTFWEVGVTLNICHFLVVCMEHAENIYFCPYFGIPKGQTMDTLFHMWHLLHGAHIYPSILNILKWWTRAWTQS